MLTIHHRAMISQIDGRNHPDHTAYDSLWFAACVYSQSNLVPRYRLIIYCTTHHKILDDWKKSTIADRAMINLALHKLQTRTLNKIKPRTLNKKSTIVASCEKNLVNRGIQSLFVRIHVNWHECSHHWQSSSSDGWYHPSWWYHPLLCDCTLVVALLTAPSCLYVGWYQHDVIMTSFVDD